MEKPFFQTSLLFHLGRKSKNEKEQHEQNHQETDGKHNGKSMEKPSSKQVYFFTWGEKLKKKRKT